MRIIPFALAEADGILIASLALGGGRWFPSASVHA
jgi:hypothetical protein